MSLLEQLQKDVASKSDIEVFHASDGYALFNTDIDVIIAIAKDQKDIDALKTIKDDWHKGIYSNFCSPLDFPVTALLQQLYVIMKQSTQTDLCAVINGFSLKIAEDVYHDD